MGSEASLLVGVAVGTLMSEIAGDILLGFEVSAEDAAPLPLRQIVDGAGIRSTGIDGASQPALAQASPLYFGDR